MKNNIDKTKSIRLLSRPEIKNHEEKIPPKAEGDFRMCSYNVCASFFDSSDNTPDQRHISANRMPYIFEMLEKFSDSDVICLQEMSPEQATQIQVYLEKKGYTQSYFLSQTPSEVKVGTIAKSAEVSKWQGKYVGTPLIGTFLKSDWSMVEQGRYWYNPEPDKVPAGTLADRGKIDMGWGNMNSYRACLWNKITDRGTGQEIYIFNSHYPMSGNSFTRLNCAKLDRAKIAEIVGDEKWISTGDRNTVPLPSDTDIANPKSIYDNLVAGCYDMRDDSKYIGVHGTYLGFTYDRFHVKFKNNNFAELLPSKHSYVLDVMISNKIAHTSFCHPGAYNPNSQKLLPISEAFADHQNDGRYFASDHCLIGADYRFDVPEAFIES